MKKLIKMDLYRFIKSKSFYLILLIDVLFTIVMLGCFALSEFSIKQVAELGIQMDAVELLKAMLPQKFEQYIQLMFSGNYIIVYLVIFILIFCGNEYKNGYIKNIGSLVPKKYQMALSKGIVVILAEVIFYLATGLVVVCGCGLMGRLSVDNVGTVVRILGMSFLANLSLTSVAMMGFMLIRKTMPIMISSIVYIMLGGTVFQLINLLIRVITQNEQFDLNHFTNLGNLTSYIMVDTTAKDTIVAAVVAVVFLGASMVVSCVALNRKDIA